MVQYQNPIRACVNEDDNDLNKKTIFSVVITMKCPQCGNEVPEDAAYCVTCGEKLKGPRTRDETTAPAGAADHLSTAFKLATEKPMVFAPALIGGVISIIISRIWTGPMGVYGFSELGSTPSASPFLTPFLAMMGIASLIGSIISYILHFASIDMSRDAYLDQPLDLMSSVNYVLRRMLTFIIASIVGGLLSITIVLIPVVILMFVILVIDETGIGDAISKAFRVLMYDLGDVIIVLIVSIVGSIVLSWVPFISSLLGACLDVVISLAFIDIYFHYKGRSYSNPL